MYVGFSPDGFRWTADRRNPVLRTWPEGYDKPTRHGVGDIVDVYYDPLSRHYGAAVKVHAVPEDAYAPGPRAGKGIRRLVGLSTSADFLHWERPRRIFHAERAIAFVPARGTIVLGVDEQSDANDIPRDANAAIGCTQ